MTTGGYTGMGGATVAHYQNVIGRMNNYAQGGNVAQPNLQPVQGQFQQFQAQPAPVYAQQVYPNAVQPMNYAANIPQPINYGTQPMYYNPQPMNYVQNVFPQTVPMPNLVATPNMMPATYMPTAMSFGGSMIPPPSAIMNVNDPSIAQGRNALRGLLANM